VARVIERGRGQLYVHFLNTDKRLDDWVQESETRALEEGDQVELEPEPPQRGHKRKRSDSPSNKPTTDSAPQRDISNGVHIEDPFITGGGDSSEEEDVAEHQLLTRRRNFDMVNFGQWQMKTW
jgi:histone acetyltransferase MYST1